MTLAYALERRLRHHHGPLDYDDSLVPGKKVASLMRLSNATPREESMLGVMLRWGCSAAMFGLLHGVLRGGIGRAVEHDLRRRADDRRAGAVPTAGANSYRRRDGPAR